METIAIIVVVAVIAALVAGAVWYWQGQRRTGHLKGQYGDEYERTLSERGNRSEAERELSDREKRFERLHIKDLTNEQRDRFADEWRIVQVRFVDDPAGTIKEADGLVQKVMDTRGYPITDFEQQAADISVDHPQVVTHYRAAHGIALRHEQDGASTEDLRQALIHFRALFQELLGEVPIGR